MTAAAFVVELDNPLLGLAFLHPARALPAPKGRRAGLIPTAGARSGPPTNLKSRDAKGGGRAAAPLTGEASRPVGGALPTSRGKASGEKATAKMAEGGVS
jgi:hypothetical protein